MTSTASSRTIGGRNRLLAAPAVAGVAYLLAWVVGLAVWPSNLDVAASGGQVVAAYTGHRGVAMTQSLLVHGVAAVALAVVVLALGQAARRRDAGPLARATVVAGVGAAVVSLVQCALGLWLAGWAVPDGDAGRAGTLFAAINRLDGVKMLALAAMAAGGAALVRRTHLLPGWLGYLGALLAVALVVSGIGYLLLRSALAPAAFVSGPLLLVWVTATGIWLGRLPERQRGDVADAAATTNYSYQVAKDSGRPGGEMGADRDDTGDPRRDPRQQDQARRTVDRAARRWDGGGRRHAHADR